MAGIAISYRRDDTGWITGRIFDRLKAHYGKSVGGRSKDESMIFMDYDSMPIGVDFREHIRGILDRSDVVLAIIGPSWAGVDSDAPRITRDDDWVRIEIETALKREIPVIPVLIDRTPMPRPDTLPEEIRDLVYRHAATIDSQIDFNSHMERLIRRIDGLIPPRIGSASRWWEQFGSSSLYAVASIAVCIVVAVVAFVFFNQRKPVQPVYAGIYNSPELGVTVVFPNNILSLDNTERQQGKLTLRDGNGQTVVTLRKTALPANKDPKVGRQNEIDTLTGLGSVVTYMAPEKDKNWTNWYVLSGLNHGTEFYFRRWYCNNAVVSMEFTYPKDRASLFDSLVQPMTSQLVLQQCSP
jgi:hypothetical protein